MYFNTREHKQTGCQFAYNILKCTFVVLWAVSRSNAAQSRDKHETCVTKLSHHRLRNGLVSTRRQAITKCNSKQLSNGLGCKINSVKHESCNMAAVFEVNGVVNGVVKTIFNCGDLPELSENTSCKNIRGEITWRKYYFLGLLGYHNPMNVILVTKGLMKCASKFVWNRCSLVATSKWSLVLLKGRTICDKYK